MTDTDDRLMRLVQGTLPRSLFDLAWFHAIKLGWRKPSAIAALVEQIVMPEARKLIARARLADQYRRRLEEWFTDLLFDAIQAEYRRKRRRRRA